MIESGTQELKKTVCGPLTRAGAGGTLLVNTAPSSFDERAQGRSERDGPCFFLVNVGDTLGMAWHA